MIKSIKLKFGKAPSLEPEEIQATPVTVFVGPNNSGKSKVLNEIGEFCNSGEIHTRNVILQNIEFLPSTQEQAEEKVRQVTLSVTSHHLGSHWDIVVGKGDSHQQVLRQELVSTLIDPNKNVVKFCLWYLRYNTLKLDGRQRIALVDSQAAGDLQQPPRNSLQVLFRDDKKRSEVRRIVYDAFDFYFVIDPTELGTFRVRLSSKLPQTEIEEKGIHEEAVKFHAGALPIYQTSDGVKAFTGIITEIFAGDPTIILLDEPEAFLHPSLSFKLGKEIARATMNAEKRLFVSTHSPDFVMGCIQSGARVNIIRLTYREELATSRLLPSQEILRLMRNPLLSSTGVLSGLFYEFVVVTESDTDRAFYQEVNERLLRYKPEFGIPNCLFINAQNKQTVQTIIRPLRELGIPAVGIVDIDILKDGGSSWIGFLESGFVPQLEHQSLGQLRSAVKQKFDTNGKNMKKDGGIEILDSQDKEAANNLFDQLESYGLFVVRCGELESWLKNLQAAGHGPNWLIDIFIKMGDDPDASNYMKPSNDDVWQFIYSIKKWLTNQQRKGIPL